MTKEKILENFEEEPKAPNFEEEEKAPNFEEEEEVGEAEPEPVPSEVSLDDLDAVPQSDKFRKINYKEEIGLTEVTISKVSLGKAITQDKNGKHIPPIEKDNDEGKYYKAKVIVEIEEEINGDNIREFIPSIFYSVDDEGNVAKIPSVPKACADDKLDDKFTSKTAKLRNLYSKAFNIDPKDVSSSSFLKGLVGKKFKVKREDGTYKKRDWSKIEFLDFVVPPSETIKSTE